MVRNPTNQSEKERCLALTEREGRSRNSSNPLSKNKDAMKIEEVSRRLNRRKGKTLYSFEYQKGWNSLRYSLT